MSQGIEGHWTTLTVGRWKWTRRNAVVRGMWFDQDGNHHGRGTDAVLDELARLRTAMSKSNDEICQTLGQALGYPWFKDDQTNFPGATEAHGVCVGNHVAESLADEAARALKRLGFGAPAFPSNPKI